MSSDLLHCERCGAALAAPGAVCEQCDRDLAIAGQKCETTVGKYRCPECACKFHEPVVVLYPERAPWYRLQYAKPKCPHCGCWLRDRASSFTEPLLRTYILVLVVCNFSEVNRFFAKNWRWPISIVGFFLATISLFFYIRHIRSEHRYAAAKRQKPAKQ